MTEQRPPKYSLVRWDITRPVSTVTEALVRRFLWKVATNTLLAIIIGAAPTQAQLATQHIKGTTGLKAGSQPR